MLVFYGKKYRQELSLFLVQSNSMSWAVTANVDVDTQLSNRQLQSKERSLARHDQGKAMQQQKLE